MLLRMMRKIFSAVLILLIVSPVLAETDSTNILKALKDIYERKQGQEVEQSSLNLINEQFQNNTKIQKILEVWSESEFSLEITENNTRVFAITALIENKTIERIYFGITEGVGEGSHVYIKLEMNKYSQLLREWINLLSEGQPSLTDFIGLYFKTNTVTLSALVSKDIVIQPVWVIFTKSLSMLEALGSYHELVQALQTA